MQESMFAQRMTYRHHMTPFLIYPENKLKSLWDFIMTIVLLVSCVITPLDIAFSNEKNTTNVDLIVKWTIDFLFAMDIFVTFNSATYDEEDNIVEDRKSIAIRYL